MKKYTFLRKHRYSSSFHFRAVIPLDLRYHFSDKRDFTISLRTGIYKDALRLSLGLYTFSHYLFSKVRFGEMKLDIAGIKEILKVEITRSIKHAQLTKWDAITDVKKYESLLNNAKEKEGFKDDYLVEKVDSRIEEHLKNLGYESSKNKYEFRQLRANFIELWILRNELKEQHLLGNDETNLDEWFKQKCNENFGLDLPVSIIDLPTYQEPSVTSTQFDDADGERILEVLENFLNFWNKRDNKESTTKRYETKVRHFVEIVGNLQLKKITSKVIREYKEKYLQIPNRWEQNQKYKNKSVSEILKMDTSLEEKRGMHSLNQSIRALSTFSKWCCANSDMEVNPFSSATEKFKREDVIKGFSDEEISKIFNPQTFLSSTINRRGYQPNRVGNYFAPLIMCFTGARVSEVMQLHLSDIRKIRTGRENAIWIFDFNSDECDCCPDIARKSIKNKSSHRIVPVHPALIKVGICRLRNLLESMGETRLFHKNTFHKSKGGWADKFSFFFNRTYLPKIGLKHIKGRKIDTHSFRHGFTNKMKQNGVLETYAREFVGHHHDSMTFTTYSERHSPYTLMKEVIPHISYEGLQLDKIQTNWKNKILKPPKGE